MGGGKVDQKQCRNYYLITKFENAKGNSICMPECINNSYSYMPDCGLNYLHIII